MRPFSSNSPTSDNTIAAVFLCRMKWMLSGKQCLCQYKFWKTTSTPNWTHIIHINWFQIWKTLGENTVWKKVFLSIVLVTHLLQCSPQIWKTLGEYTAWKKFFLSIVLVTYLLQCSAQIWKTLGEYTAWKKFFLSIVLVTHLLQCSAQFWKTLGEYTVWKKIFLSIVLLSHLLQCSVQISTNSETLCWEGTGLDRFWKV